MGLAARLARGTTSLAALLVAQAVCATATPRSASAQATAAPGRATPPVRDPRMESFVDSLLSRMTLEEKLGQLNQIPGRGTPTGPAVPEGGEADVRAGRVGSFLSVYGAATVRRLQHLAVDSSRLHVPLLFAFDVIHGFRTIFPVPLAEASSWDPAMVERAARIAAVEATSAGVDWTFAPMVDIARDPRWGRIVEGAGEDPVLGTAMAAARVRGFQGPDLSADDAMMATAKHFVAYGAAEGGRDYNTVDMSERRLREVYLPPFRAAADAGAASVMPSFNSLNGVPMHANGALLNGVLRREWGWDGLVVSDWAGIEELVPHGVAATPADAARLALDAGVDVDMADQLYVENLPGLLAAGKVKQAAVDDAVRRVLRAKYRLGLFRDPYRRADPERERRSLLTPEHRAAARQEARESIVLLENRGGVLPLSEDVGTLAVISALADDARSALGSWAAAGRPEEAVTVLDGIRRAVSPGTRVLYARGVPVRVVGGGPTPATDSARAATADTSGIAEAVAIARQADAVVLVLGETADMSGEASSRASLDLPGAQLELAKAVVAASAGKPVVAVLMNGRPLAIDWLDAHVPGILECWFLGTEMGSAVADVVFGDFDPGGKLPVTFPRTVGQVPIHYAHASTGRPPVADNHYTSKYIDAPWTPLYPFGYGMSYTTFRYGAPVLSATSISATDSLTVTFDVTNTGSRAGDEVVQLYLRDEVASVTRPVEMLRRFRRIALAPG